MWQSPKNDGDFWWGLVKHTAIILMVVGVVSPFVVLWIYGANLGALSHSVDAWSGFGALMAGVFTLLSAIATTSTLLLLIYQQKLTRDTTLKQLEALTFDQYISHRKIFIQRLKDLEYRFDGALSFKSYDELYGWIFPNNNPVNVSYKSSVLTEEGKARGLQACGVSYKQIVNFIESLGSGQTQSIHDLLKRLSQFKDALGITYRARGGEKYGDVLISGENTGLNIFCPDASLERLEYVFNSFLFYSGNDTVRILRGKITAKDKATLFQMVLDGIDISIHEDPIGLTKQLLELYRLYNFKDSSGRHYLGTMGSRIEWIIQDPDRVAEYAKDPERLDKMVRAMSLRLALIKTYDDEELTSKILSARQCLKKMATIVDRLRHQIELTKS